jgi:hypothetical protein
MDRKVYENRVRRMAARQGYRLAKSYRRDPRAIDFDVWWLFSGRNKIVFGGARGATIEECEEFLTHDGRAM